MGTHPIFESDFDCLTEVKKICHLPVPGRRPRLTMASLLARQLAPPTSNWPSRPRPPPPSRTRSMATTSRSRASTLSPATPKTENSAVIGQEGEFDTQGHKIKAIVSGSASSLELKAVSGWANATAKIVGGQLIESVTHNESGQTVTSTWER